MGGSYAEAGISFERRSEALRRLQAVVGDIGRQHVLSPPNGFCGIVDVRESLRWAEEDPVLVVASRMQTFNDTACARAMAEAMLKECSLEVVHHGAIPIGVVDGIAAHRLSADVVEEIALGLKLPLVHQRWLDGRTPVLGGELAELPLLLRPEAWVVSVTVLGIASRSSVERYHRRECSQSTIVDPERANGWCAFDAASGVQCLSLRSILGPLDHPVLGVTLDGVGAKALISGARIGMDVVHHGVNDLAVHGLEAFAVLPSLVHDGSDADVVTNSEEWLSRTATTAAPRRCTVLPIHGHCWPDTVYTPILSARAAHLLDAITVGVAEQRALLNGAGVREGDCVFGLASSGPHTNGYHLILDAVHQEYFPTASIASQQEGTLEQQLGEPHVSYASALRTLREHWPVTGLAHVTGGGIAGNVQRILPAGLSAELMLPRRPDIFERIARYGQVDEDEMHRVFNLGVGLVGTIRCSVEEFSIFREHCRRLGHEVVAQGRVVQRDERGPVVLRPAMLID